MSTVILKGEEAFHFAETHDLLLNQYPGDDGKAREGIAPEDARKLLAEHPELLWVETHIGVNSGEPPHHW